MRDRFGRIVLLFQNLFGFGTKNRAHIAGVLTVLGILTFCIQIAGFQFEIDVAKLLVNNIRNVDIDLGVVYRIKMDLIAEDYSFSKGS